MSIVKTAVVASAVVGVTLHYWVLPAVDKVTPWQGALPGSCGAPAQARPAGFVALANDTGRLLDRLEQGPPTPADMVGWFRSAGTGARTAYVAFEAGTNGQQLLPLASTSAPQAMLVTASAAPEDTAARALLAAGATPAEAVALTAIAGPESGYNPTASNPTSSATGLWQMLDMHGLTVAERQDPAVAARKALELARERNGAGLRSHWAETYEQSKSYEPRAAAAVARVQGQATPVACDPATTPGLTRVSAGGPIVEQAIAFALAQQGKPYLWGAVPMEVGGPVPARYDCSSLIDSAFLAAGVDIPGRATTRTLVNYGEAVSGDPQRGDIVFTSAGHVGLALGDGQMVHAPQTGDVVKVSPIWSVTEVRRVTGTQRSA